MSNSWMSANSWIPGDNFTLTGNLKLAPRHPNNRDKDRRFYMVHTRGGIPFPDLSQLICESLFIWHQHDLPQHSLTCSQCLLNEKKKMLVKPMPNMVLKIWIVCGWSVYEQHVCGPMHLWLMSAEERRTQGEIKLCYVLQSRIRSDVNT